MATPKRLSTLGSPQRLPPVHPQERSAPPSVAPPEEIPPPIADRIRIVQSGHQDPLHWWDALVRDPLLPDSRWVKFNLQTLLADALVNSPRIESVNQQNQVALEGILDQEATFDSRLLLDNRYGRTSDPVGNSLVTGGPPRLREEDWGTNLGIRKQTRLGGEFEFRQELGLLDSNSLFFIPPNQGNSRLTVSLSQPILAGGGQLYAERLILEARLNSQATDQEAIQEIQSTLAELMLSYWNLYERRSQLIQQKDLLQRGIHLEQIVQGRRDLDTGPIEHLRIKEQLTIRKTRILRTRTDLENQQTRITALIGSQNLRHDLINEMIPLGNPQTSFEKTDLRQAILTGLHHRPELAIAAAELETKGLQLQISRNQLLPQLNALVEAYVAGLNGRSDVAGSFADQFSEGEPGFSAALEFEMPVGRRSAHAKNRAAMASYQKQLAEVRKTVLVIRSDTEIAVREMNVTQQVIAYRQATLLAALAEEQYLTRRWELLGGDGSSAGLVIEDLLEAQNRRTAAEELLVTAQVEYLRAVIRLHLAMGTLLVEQPLSTRQVPPPLSIAQ